MEAGSVSPLVVLSAPNHRVVKVVVDYSVTETRTRFVVEAKTTDSMGAEQWRLLETIERPSGRTSELSDALYELISVGEMKP